jgi:A/G-specific adenine glycosylase
MLQQTQVATVMAYFQRFIAALPRVTDLAGATEQQVLRLWQGLGYYRRARNLHRAAQMVVAEFGGQVPGTVEQLLRLPGVGRYTAGAIASIAHGVQAPILDGNVARVLARLTALHEPIDAPQVRDRLWELAAALVPAEQPGDFNQALMELGATVCTPRSPRCMFCPLREHCSGFAQGVAEGLPRSRPKRKPVSIDHHVIAVQRRGRYLFEQRPDTGLWAGMWQLLSFEQPLPPAPEAVRDRTGLSIEYLATRGAFTHATTHRRVRFHVHHAKVLAGRLRPGAGVWRELDDLDDLPLAIPQWRAIALLG